MGIQLWIAEKPSMARDIAFVLGAQNKNGIKYEGTYQGKTVWVTWSIGHLMTIADPEAHDPKWKSWRVENLPIMPTEIKWQVIDRTAKHFAELKKLVQNKNVSEIVNACDAGREGELIFRTIYYACQKQIPTARFWVSSLTVSAIKSGIEQLQPASVYDPLSSAAYCRAIADWIVGMNATRAMTARAGSLVTLGRVQTPTLAMIVERDLKIENFKPEPYWHVEVDLESYRGAKWKGKWIRSTVASDDLLANGQVDEQTDEHEIMEEVTESKDKKSIAKKITQKSKAEQIAQKVKQQYGKIIHLERKEESVPPPQLYHLTALQQDANVRFGFSADQTLKIAQKLYEYHKAISYPRTDARYITPDLVPQLPKVVAQLQAPYQDLIKDWKPVKLGGRYVNAKKVNDHHAIIPTNKKISLDALDTDERKIYDLIVRSLLMALSENAIDEHIHVESEILGEVFGANWKRELKAGWRVMSGKSAKNAQELAPNVMKDEPVRVLESAVLDLQTQAPHFFQDSSILSAMEKAGNQLKEKALKDLLQGSGLGTPATRANIIENLLHRQYVKRDQKRLISTQNGRDVIRNLQNEELKSVHLTADWENLLKQIEDGQIAPQIFYDKLKAFIPKMLSDLANTPAMQLTKVQDTPRSVNRTKNNSEDQSTTKSTRTRTTKSTAETSTTAKSTTAKSTTAKSTTAKSTTAKSTTAKSTTAKSTTTKKSAISLPEKIDQTLCPKCKQAYLIKGRSAFGCGRWREGCHFLIPFQYDGIVILERQAIEIAILYRVKNFLEKEGQYYDLHLCLEIEPPLKLQVNPDSKYAHTKTKGFSEKSQAYQYQNVESSPTSWRNLAKRS